MSNTPATLNPAPATKSTASTSRKLIQAAALAAVLVPLGSVAMEAGPITCGMGSEFFAGSGCTNHSATAASFDWGDYSVFLELFGVTGQVILTVNDALLTAAEFAVRTAGLGIYTPVPVVDPASNPVPYRDFQISASGGGTYDSYDVSLSWLYDSNFSHPDTFNGTDGHVRLLQNPGSVPGNEFTVDMCETYGCVYTAYPFGPPIDPRIDSGDTAFSSKTLGWTPVPEPGTLALLGSGVTGLLYKYRRRRQKV